MIFSRLILGMGFLFCGWITKWMVSIISFHQIIVFAWEIFGTEIKYLPWPTNRNIQFLLSVYVAIPFSLLPVLTVFLRFAKLDCWNPIQNVATVQPIKFPSWCCHITFFAVLSPTLPMHSIAIRCPTHMGESLSQTHDNFRHYGGSSGSFRFWQL